MWFALGLVSLTLSVIWSVRIRWNPPWPRGRDGSPGRLLDFRLRYRTKDHIVGCEVAYAAPKRYRFELKRETWVDRFFKWVGLSVEAQFGEAEFDRLVYVASNDDHLNNRLADSPALRQAASGIFLAPGADCYVHKVVCGHGVLRLHLRLRAFSGQKTAVERLSSLQFNAEKPLRELVALLQHAPSVSDGGSSGDRFAWWAALLVGITTALLINGLVVWTRNLFLANEFIVDSGRIFQLSLVTSAAIVLTLLLANVVLLARSARGHLVLLELLIAGSAGAMLTTGGALRDLNVDLDTSRPQLFETPIVHKYTTYSRKGGTRYYVTVSDWNSSGSTHTVSVSGSFYRSVPIGRKMLIQQHAGYLGARWAMIIGLAPERAPPQ